MRSDPLTREGEATILSLAMCVGRVLRRPETAGETCSCGHNSDGLRKVGSRVLGQLPQHGAQQISVSFRGPILAFGFRGMTLEDILFVLSRCW